MLPFKLLTGIIAEHVCTSQPKWLATGRRKGMKAVTFYGSASGKVTMVPASHWPCVIDFSRLSVGYFIHHAVVRPIGIEENTPTALLYEVRHPLPFAVRL